MSNILVTGGSGYIGSHLIKELKKQDHEVFNLDLKVGLDLKGDLDEIFENGKFDVVIHLAALVDLREAEKEPIKYYDNNVFATVNLVEHMIRHQVDKIVFASSAAVFGNSVYGKTKLLAENIIKDSELDFTILRYFNVAGGKLPHYKKSLIPQMVRALVNDEIFTINGRYFNTKDGTAERDYIHVDDVVKATIMGIELHGIFEVASGKTISVLEVVNEVSKLGKLKYKYGKRIKGDMAISESKGNRVNVGRIKSITDMVEDEYYNECKNKRV